MALSAGCGGTPEGPATADVTGHVTLNGAPIVNADVFFHPVDPDAATQACQAVTDADGNFSVQTHIEAGEYKPGMIPGEYRVSVSKLDTSQVTTTFTPPKNTLPGKYASPETSGFTATVLADKQNNFEFSLEDKG